MRLTPEEVTAIKAAVQQAFGRQARVWLFGSRVDDSKKGGDIDLLVEAPEGCAGLLDKKLQVLSTLMLSLGEQKVDLVLARDASRLVEQEARSKGIEL
ncbi:nucleotidyltransferase family protein [Marinospirillum alkaliphilum]|uniref:Nucleotidyltransferase domain-containing protein n=1 Tax=Marinospirillum alkaliphilum DSM 21637 TaxID=1122209 RepID=A0A1K1ZRM8_9GAMM|nr:nucleotidyltransferase domain-containing protein [Marinospirillum alkaliphilum]SFX76825.1 Nucleotidyltransferase domain-containing protein [Marinospirillum alkaliphilum DSM 21637]